MRSGGCEFGSVQKAKHARVLLTHLVNPFSQTLARAKFTENETLLLLPGRRHDGTRHRCSRRTRRGRGAYLREIGRAHV